MEISQQKPNNYDIKQEEENTATASTRCLSSVSAGNGAVTAMAVTTGNGEDMLYAGFQSGIIGAWRFPDLRQFRTIYSGDCSSIKALLVSTNKLFSGGQDGKIRVWERCSRCGVRHRLAAVIPPRASSLAGYVLANFSCQGHVDAVSSLAITNCGRLLYSASWDKTLVAWRLWDFRCVDSFDAHDDAVNAVVTASECLVFTGAADGSVKAWERREGHGNRKRGVHFYHCHLAVLQRASRVSINALVASADGRVVYGGHSDGTVGVWVAEGDGSVQWKGSAWRAHGRAVLSVYRTDDGIVLSGSADGTVRAWKNCQSGGEGQHFCVRVFGSVGDCPVKCMGIVSGKSERELVVCYGSLKGKLRSWRLALLSR